MEASCHHPGNQNCKHVERTLCALRAYTAPEVYVFVPLVRSYFGPRLLGVRFELLILFDLTA